MNVLALETSGPIASAAAFCDDRPLAEERLERHLEHGRSLVVLLDRVIRRAGWQPRRDVELIAVSQGPGSYTGLRVGLACAKTLAVFLERPLVGVCSLDVLAYNAPDDWGAVLVVTDARRGQVYAAAYRRREGLLERSAGPAVMMPEQAARLVRPPALVVGDGLRRFGDAFPRPALAHAPEHLWLGRAAAVARLGLAAFRAGRTGSALEMEPIYLRIPEAEEKRLARPRTGSGGSPGPA